MQVFFVSALQKNELKEESSRWMVSCVSYQTQKRDKSLLWDADDFQRVRQFWLVLGLSVAQLGVKDIAGFKELQRLL